MNLIELNKSSIQLLCEKHQVASMYAFGSVVSSRFNDKSDVDLLVKFKEIDLNLYFLNYLSLKESIESILNKKVDLVEEQTLKNPILIRSINKNKQLVYG